MNQILELFMDNTLDNIEKEIWLRLFNGAVKPKDPFGYFTIGSKSGASFRLRTVVLRKTNISEKTILLYTDIRSQKWKDWQKDIEAKALFYDGYSKIQVILDGEVELIQSGNLWEDSWQKTSMKSRKSYMTELPPGTPFTEKTTGLSEGMEDRDPKLEESEPYRVNFGLVRFQTIQMEYLHLDKTGNSRALFQYDQERKFNASWLIP